MVHTWQVSNYTRGTRQRCVSSGQQCLTRRQLRSMIIVHFSVLDEFSGTTDGDNTYDTGVFTKGSDDASPLTVTTAA